MSQFLITVIAFLVAISILVAVHEFGHFWVARKLGFKVLRFSIGFGRPIWRRTGKVDNTEYMISAIPLGGYVKMLDEREGPVADDEVHRAFNRQTPGRRLAVLVAGPAFNFLFAVVAYWLLFMAGVTGLRPVIGDIVAGSPADLAGMASGDEIVAIGEKRISTWEQVPVTLIEELLDDGEFTVAVRDENGRDRWLLIDVRGRESELSDPQVLMAGLGFNRWYPELPAVIGSVNPGGSAEAAGLISGDRVLAAAGQDIGDWQAWVEFVQARPGETVTVRLERDGEEISLPLGIDAVTREPGERVIGMINAGPQYPDESAFSEMLTTERYGPLAALYTATLKTWDMSALTLRLLGRMVIGDISPKNISGPISIATYAGIAATLGLEEFLGLLAILSISLGIINLLPIPLLDGGQMVFVTAEAIKGRPISERAQLWGQQVGIVLLIIIMGFAFYNDINRHFLG